MSQENVDVVRSLFSGFQQRGPAGVFDTLSSEVEWQVRPDLPDSQTYRGHEGMRELFATFDEVLDEQWYSPLEFISVGDLVVVPLRGGGRGKTSGVTVEETEETWVFTVRHGAISLVREYATKEAAIQAAGLAQ